MSVTRTYTVDVQITPQELATAFCEMDSFDQAEFFAAIKPISDKWPGAGLCWQSCEINRSLDEAGRTVLETLASHLPAETLRTLAENAA